MFTTTTSRTRHHLYDPDGLLHLAMYGSCSVDPRAGTVIVNLMHDPVNIYPESEDDGGSSWCHEELFTLHPDTGTSVDVSIDRVRFDLTESDRTEGAVTGAEISLPEPRPGTSYLVSVAVGHAAATMGRTDVLVPHDYVRLDDGYIIGCRRLAQPVAPRLACEHRPVSSWRHPFRLR